MSFREARGKTFQKLGADTVNKTVQPDSSTKRGKRHQVINVEICSGILRCSSFSVRTLTDRAYITTGMRVHNSVKARMDSPVSWLAILTKFLARLYRWF